MTIDKARKEIVKAILHIYEEREANNIAELLMQNITKLQWSERIVKGNELLTDAQKNLLRSSSLRLQEHEPIQYVINEAWFAGMRFYVDRNVLIPRPETEELVEWVVKDVKPQTSNAKLLDVGTGSGCIAIALKKKLPDIEMWACDLNDEALNIARMNADVLGATIDFVPLNFLDPDQRKQLPMVDVIVSNPPYVPQKEKTEMKRNVVEYEPSAALFVPDNDPLIFYKAMAEFGKEKLSKGGCIYAEIHEDLGEQARELFLSMGYMAFQLRKDMQGKNRMIEVIN
jgi:release factor glutamine methyltransferase